MLGWLLVQGLALGCGMQEMGSGSLEDQARCMGQGGEVSMRAARNLRAHEMRAEPLLTHKAPPNEASVALLEPRRTPCLASLGCAGMAGGSGHIPLPELTPHSPQQQRLHLSPCPPQPGWVAMPERALSCAEESEAAEMGKFAS